MADSEAKDKERVSPVAPAPCASLAPAALAPTTAAPDAFVAAMTEAIARHRKAFSAGTTLPVAWRKTQLKRLKDMLSENQEELIAALQADLRKPKQEAYLAEIHLLTGEIDQALKNVASWAEPEKVSTPLALMPGLTSSYVQYQPRGVALILGAWNYPIDLAVRPLVAAIAAGCPAVVKPSEVSVKTSAALAQLLPKYLDKACYSCFEGGIAETTALLQQKWDFIFYTGNSVVGRVVMRAAAENLTPVVLELGGKSPTIIDEDADLTVAVKRVCSGKFMNAGQTCVAPDYMLVHQKHYDTVLKKMAETIKQWYGENPQKSNDFARIVNERHVRRLHGLMNGAEIVSGGHVDETDRYVEPTLVKMQSLSAARDQPLMQSEIFGPILPIIPFSDLNEVIGYINEHPRPLALYYFGKKNSENVLQRTQSGGVAINDTVMHVGNIHLPFGGSGESGMGCYHGIHGFLAFSHQRAVLDRSTKLDSDLRYPPYTESKLAVMKKIV